MHFPDKMSHLFFLKMEELRNESVKNINFCDTFYKTKIMNLKDKIKGDYLQSSLKYSLNFRSGCWWSCYASTQDFDINVSRKIEVFVLLSNLKLIIYTIVGHVCFDKTPQSVFHIIFITMKLTPQNLTFKLRYRPCVLAS